MLELEVGLGLESGLELGLEEGLRLESGLEVGLGLAHVQFKESERIV